MYRSLIAVNCSCGKAKLWIEKRYSVICISLHLHSRIPTYSSSCVQNLEHALLSVYLDLFSVTVLNCWVILFHKDPLNELNCECGLPNTTTPQNYYFVLSHF